MRYFPIAVGLCAVLAAPVQAQVAKPVQDDATRITVLASGLWTRLDEAGQTVSVLDLTDLQSVQGPDIARALQRLPGVTLIRSGGLGSFTSLSVRGSASERVLVLVDGARLNDVAAPSGGLDWSSVMSGGVERVELLRGSGSLVWGSDALGGVVHLTTRAADGLEASAEYGSDRQFSGALALGDNAAHHTFGLSAGYVTRRGFSSAATGSEADGFSQLSFSGRGDVELSPQWALFGSARHASGEAGIDGFPPPYYTFSDTLERQDSRQTSMRGGVEYVAGASTATLSLATSQTRRDLVDEAFSPDPYYSTTGQSTRAEARGRAAISDSLALIGGGDWEWTRFSDGYAKARTNIASTHGLLEWTAGENLRVMAGGRYDHHGIFGGAVSMAANASVNLADQWRARASWGEGFKAPSLFQLHSDYGNLQLAPERSDSFDLGLEHAAHGRAFAVTLFRNSSRNLIDFISCPPVGTGICANRPDGTYDNIGRTRSQGLELEGSVQLAAGVEAGLAYAYTTSTNLETARRLARRPRHAGTVTLDWHALDALTFGADLRVVSASFDNAANTVPLGGHALLDLRASWDFGDHVQLYGRIENAWDEGYQTAAGYATQGRAVFVGVRATM
jgi:vitamin B12 transporter